MMNNLFTWLVGELWVMFGWDWIGKWYGLLRETQRNDRITSR